MINCNDDSIHMHVYLYEAYLLLNGWVSLNETATKLLHQFIINPRSVEFCIYLVHFIIPLRCDVMIHICVCFSVTFTACQPYVT